MIYRAEQGKSLLAFPKLSRSPRGLMMSHVQTRETKLCCRGQTVLSPHRSGSGDPLVQAKVPGGSSGSSRRPREVRFVDKALPPAACANDSSTKEQLQAWQSCRLPLAAADAKGVRPARSLAFDAAPLSSSNLAVEVPSASRLLQKLQNLVFHKPKHP